MMYYAFLKPTGTGGWSNVCHRKQSEQFLYEGFFQRPHMRMVLSIGRHLVSTLIEPPLLARTQCSIVSISSEKL